MPGNYLARKTPKGAAAVEYMVLLALIGVISIGAVFGLGTSLKNDYTAISDKLANADGSATPSAPGGGTTTITAPAGPDPATCFNVPAVDGGYYDDLNTPAGTTCFNVPSDVNTILDYSFVSSDMFVYLSDSGNNSSFPEVDLSGGNSTISGSDSTQGADIYTQHGTSVALSFPTLSSTDLTVDGTFAKPGYNSINLPGGGIYNLNPANSGTGDGSEFSSLQLADMTVPWVDIRNNNPFSSNYFSCVGAPGDGGVVNAWNLTYSGGGVNPDGLMVPGMFSFDGPSYSGAHGMTVYGVNSSPANNTLTIDIGVNSISSPGPYPIDLGCNQNSVSLPGFTFTSSPNPGPGEAFLGTKNTYDHVIGIPNSMGPTTFIEIIGSVSNWDFNGTSVTPVGP